MEQYPPIEELAGSYYDIGVRHGRGNAARMRYLLQAFQVTCPPRGGKQRCWHRWKSMCPRWRKRSTGSSWAAG